MLAAGRVRRRRRAARTVHGRQPNGRLRLDGRVSTDYADNPRLLRRRRHVAPRASMGEFGAELASRTERSELVACSRAGVPLGTATMQSLDSDDQYLELRSSTHRRERSQWTRSAQPRARYHADQRDRDRPAWCRPIGAHEALTMSAGPSFTAERAFDRGVCRPTCIDSQLRRMRPMPGWSTTSIDSLSALRESLLARAEPADRSRVQAGELSVPGHRHAHARCDGAPRLELQPATLWSTRLSAGPAYVEAARRQ